ncbi:MAG: CoA-binding protein [Candidatus Anstonellales archaeon]
MELFSKSTPIAVVGASRDKSKYGYRVFHSLVLYGFRVYPVNPNAGEIDGAKAYPSISSLPEAPGLVIVVTPPSVARKVAEEACLAGAKAIWFQPGSENERAIELCRQKGVQVFHGMCFVADCLKERLL